MEIIDLDKSCVIKWRLTDICNYHCSYCIRRPLVIEDTEPNINTDFNKCMKALPYVIKIANDLNRINQKPVKIDLIGGEISIFPQLNKLLTELFNCEVVKRVNITTNLFRDVDYYLKLHEIAAKQDKILSITASFHPEYVTLDTFVSKACLLQKTLGNAFKCETVITNINTQVDDFIYACENIIKCNYMCEEDLLDISKRGQSVKNIKSSNRYRVIKDDGTEELYTTRNQVIKTYGEDGIAINTTGLRCTRDMDYVYIEQDFAIPCHDKMPIEDYTVSTTMRQCTAGRCTLCGHMSIRKV